MPSQRTILIIASAFGIAFGLLRIFLGSHITAIRQAFSPVAPLVFVFLAAAAFFFVYGTLGRVKVALFVTALVVLGFYVVA